MSKYDPNAVSYVRTEMVGELPAPAGETGIVGWVRKNLFSSVSNTILTLLALYILYLIVPGVLNFTLFDAVWSGSDRLACADINQGGELPNGWKAACWPYVGAYMKQFIYGRYPDAELWRVNIIFVMFLVGLFPLAIPSAPFKRENIIFMLGIFPVLSLVLLTGGNFGITGLLPFTGNFIEPSGMKVIVDFLIFSAILLGVVYAYMRATENDPTRALKFTIMILLALAALLFVMDVDFGLHFVETQRWGGFLMTLVIAITGIVVSLPLGILLALGRQSKMPVVKFVSVIFIEFWRGVPLITVLFMASNMLPLLLPEGVTFDKLLRALIGVALFSSAYMAEVVRGGLQAIPKGQYEGASALGLSYSQSMRMIILPQALKIVIPGIVNTFIGLFKDTTLVSIIGLLDFLGTINSSHSDATWATPVQALTSYVFCALVFFVFCFSMARYSIFMERRLDTGHKS